MKIMNEMDRKRVFWLLKKYSSYTSWKALGDAFQEFTDAWEYAVKKANPPLSSDDFWVEALKEFWDGCTAFDKSLPLLKQGDHFILRQKGNWVIYNALNYARRLMDGDEYVHDWMENKQEIINAFEQSINRIHIFLVTELDDPTKQRAPLNTENVFTSNQYPFDATPIQFNYPSYINGVPEPLAQTIESGIEVPIDGIWEPEWADRSAPKIVVTNIRNIFSPVIPGNVKKGCMNYLIAGSIAPLYQDGEKQPVMPVRWRLIWEDTRYKDGTIPSEEAEYLSSRSNSKISTAVDRVEGGQPCPQTGHWFTPAQLHSRRHFKAGEIMPIAGSDYGSTIWQWDAQQ